MKRFYCTICRKVKRVRKYPVDIANVSSDDVSLRIGECARHSLESVPVSRTVKVSDLTTLLESRTPRAKKRA